MAESCGCDAGSKDACEIAPKTIDRDGHEFPFSDVADCEVFDEQGKAHRFGSFYEGSKAIVVFVRHFLCYVCKEYIEDAARLKAENLRTASGEPLRFIVIGCSESKFIAPFRELTSYRGELYVDPKLALYGKLGLSGKMGGMSVLFKSSPHVRSSMVGGFLNSMKRMMQSGEKQGPEMQQGGAFILGPGEKQCLWAHRDSHPFDHCSINKLLEVVGAPPVEFEKKH